jgi:hypothetical protein
VGGALVACLLLVAAVVPASALTTEDCLAKKSSAWGNLRKCQRSEEGKTIKGGSGDAARCQVTFAKVVAKLRDQAAAAAIACRYADNGDNTVTDFDTGLMWVKLVALDGVPQQNILDADNRWDWATAVQMVATLDGTSADGRTLQPVPGAGGHGDWRVPTIVELATILDTSGLDCGIGGACIDPIFGPTGVGFYWSATGGVGTKWVVRFQLAQGGFIAQDNPAAPERVRAVRSAL